MLDQMTYHSTLQTYNLWKLLSLILVTASDAILLPPVLKGLSHEIFTVFLGLNVFIQTLIGTASGFSVLKRFLRF
jgi:hypothetical protein